MKKLKNMLLVTLGALFCVSASVLAADSGSTAQEPGTTPAGYFDDSGYYNSYFGFKLELPAEENDPVTTGKDVISFVLEMSNDFDESAAEDLEALLDASLEDKGSAIVYKSLAGMPVAKNGESFNVEISVEKAEDNISEETYLSNLKDEFDAYIAMFPYDYVDNEITFDKITFAGKERDFYILQNTVIDGYEAKIILFSEEYICGIKLSGFTSFETACDAFEEMPDAD